MFSLISELSLREQIKVLDYGQGVKEDLQELAHHIRSTVLERIAFCKHQLESRGQCPEFYDYWKDTLQAWEKADRLSNPDYNPYLG